MSGIVALLMERNPKLTPADIRRILTLSARRLGPGERDDNFDPGLIDPLKALQLADSPKAGENFARNATCVISFPPPPEQASYPYRYSAVANPG